MPAHEIRVTLPTFELGKTDATFDVRSGGEKLGELRLSIGDLEWWPKNAKVPVVKSWEQFAAWMAE